MRSGGSIGVAIAGRASSSVRCVFRAKPSTGCSGRLSFSSGSSRLGNSGRVLCKFCVGTAGRAGAVRMAVIAARDLEDVHCFLLVSTARVVAVFSLAQERAQQRR